MTQRGAIFDIFGAFFGTHWPPLPMYSYHFPTTELLSRHLLPSTRPTRPNYPEELGAIPSLEGACGFSTLASWAAHQARFQAEALLTKKSIYFGGLHPRFLVGLFNTVLAMISSKKSRMQPPGVFCLNAFPSLST